MKRGWGCVVVWTALAVASWATCTMLALEQSSPTRHAHLVCYTPLHPHRHKKNDPRMRVVLVGLPGFEPRMTGPESVVLPLHHSPIFVFDGAKVE